MIHRYEDILINFQSHGWTVSFYEPAKKLPLSILARYPWIPAEVEQVIEKLQNAISPDETFWLLTSTDYLGESDSAFIWNEFEMQSLEAACDDQTWTEAIRRFWDQHFPIAICVKDGYSYYALTESGSVVHGSEPEYEDVNTVATSYIEFLQQAHEEPAGG